jgi:hypothetical protein
VRNGRRSWPRNLNDSPTSGEDTNRKNRAEHWGQAPQQKEAGSMGQVRVVHMDDEKPFAAMREFFESDNPDLRLSRIDVDGSCELRSTHGGMRVVWIFRGQGEVFVPAGFRTQ